MGGVKMVDVEKFIAEKIEEIKEKVGDQIAVNALSGGVDSSVVAILAHKALGDKVKNIFLDDGLMRLNEPETIKESFAKIGIDVEVKDVAAKFFEALKGIEDGEEKRKAFRDTFYKVLGEAVKESGGKVLLQGTIKPDIEETKATDEKHQLDSKTKNMLDSMTRLVAAYVATNKVDKTVFKDVQASIEAYNKLANPAPAAAPVAVS